MIVTISAASRDLLVVAVVLSIVSVYNIFMHMGSTKGVNHHAAIVTLTIATYILLICLATGKVSGCG